MVQQSEIRSFSVSQYNQAIQRRLAEVPQVWVQGVITQLKTREPMVYLSLAEFREGQERPVSTLELNCWTKDWRVFEQRFAEMSLPVEIQAELKVSLLVKADYYVPWGKFQPRIMDINPEFTLGELALTREKILAALKKDGLLDLNKSLAMPSPCLRIGLITAPNSAAYHDFCEVLNLSPFAFQIKPFFAKMQGDHCAISIIHILREMDYEALDVLCIIRGGGSKTDLVYFDNEELCREIALAPIPILTGIGHQIDTSIADMVAWENRITPTDCARYLVQMATEVLHELHLFQNRLKEICQLKLRQEQQKVNLRSQRIRQDWNFRHEKAQHQLDFHQQKLLHTVHSALKEHQLNLQSRKVQIERADPSKLLQQGWTLSLHAQSGKKIKPSEFTEGMEIKTLTLDAEIHSTITKIERKPKPS